MTFEAIQNPANPNEFGPKTHKAHHHAKVRFVLDQEDCIGCAICADVCEQSALDFAFQAAWPLWNKERCNGCTQCMQQCPTGAIVVSFVRNKV